MKILTPVQLHLLTIVGTEELSGREIANFYFDEFGKTISYGTLYTSFRRLKEAGWVSVRDDRTTDGRIRFFRITGSGMAALKNGRKFYGDLADFRFTPA